MKTIHTAEPYTGKMRIFVLAAILSIGLSFMSPAFAWYFVDLNSKEVKDLGNMAGDWSTTPTAINDSGRVVGRSESLTGVAHAFITGPNGVGMTYLNSLGDESAANDINTAGQVIGSFRTGTVNHAFITGPSGVGITDLGSLDGGDSYAYGINNAGQVVGQLRTEVPFTTSGFITGPNGVDITHLGGNAASADDINDAGQVVGTSTTGEPFYFASAFITGPDGVGMTNLGSLDRQSIATGINATGEAIGFSFPANGNLEESSAFITGPNGVGMTELESLGGGTYAADINNTGQVVGSSRTIEGVSHAFVTGPNGVGMTDLNSLLSLPAGVILTEAVAINNLGQVVVIGEIAAIPEPEIYAMLLAGVGLLGFIGRCRRTA